MVSGGTRAYSCDTLRRGAGRCSPASVRATLQNRLALAIWAVTIIVLVAIGIATWFVGLVVIMPVLGHASWHAYRDLVDRDVHDPMY